MELYPKNGNIIYILNILKKYSDEEHILQITDIKEKVKEIYDVEIDPRTIRRNINLLKYKLNYDISTRDENKQGYFIYKDPETEFEPGELRAIIDQFSYANYITPNLSQSIIDKCKNMQNIYENEKLKDYKVYINNTKTDNLEVIKNIEDISNAIHNKNKIKFEYWKYSLNPNLEKEITNKITATPFTILYNLQQFYAICLKDGKNELYSYRLDRMKNVKIVEPDKKIAINEKKLEEFIKSMVSMFGGKKENIVVNCNIELLDNVIDLFGKDSNIKKLDNNTFQLELEVDIEGFKFWILRNIEKIEVIKPISFKNEIKNILTNASKKC